MNLHLVLAAALQALGFWSSPTQIGGELCQPAMTTETVSDFSLAGLGGFHEEGGDMLLAPDQDGVPPPLREQREGSEGSDAESGQGDAVALVAIAQPNLRVVGITHQAYVYPDNTCSVIFYVRIQNVGTATAWSLSVGAKGWGTPNISTCTGSWRAFNTTANLALGQYRTVAVYGPGYVGPRVLKGTSLTITGYADVHCSVAESSESDNSRNAAIRVGF